MFNMVLANTFPLYYAVSIIIFRDTSQRCADNIYISSCDAMMPVHVTNRIMRMIRVPVAIVCVLLLLLNYGKCYIKNKGIQYI